MKFKNQQKKKNSEPSIYQVNNRIQGWKTTFKKPAQTHQGDSQKIRVIIRYRRKG